jgi:hypothetical protein
MKEKLLANNSIPGSLHLSSRYGTVHDSVNFNFREIQYKEKTEVKTEENLQRRKESMKSKYRAAEETLFVVIILEVYRTVRNRYGTR